MRGVRSFLLIAFSVLAAGASPVQVHALDEQFFSGNDILFYNPDVCSGTSTGSTSTTLVEGDNTKKAFFYFTGKGLTGAHAAGIVGNLLQESGVNPKSVQAGGPGRGIAQWSAGGRWASFKSWAGSKDIYDLGTQLEFMWYEMTHVSPWKLSLQGSRDPRYPSLKDITEDTRAAAVKAGHSFGYLYERFGVAGARDKFAGDVWAKYNGQVSSSGASSSDTGDGQSGCAGAASDGTCPNAPPGWVQVTNKVVQVACAEWNKKVVEDAGENCDTAGDITKYAKATGYGRCGLSWCGMFLGYVYKTAGFPFPSSAHVGSVPAVYSYLGSIGAKRSPSSTPKPGDVVTYGQEHEGIVVGVDGKYVTTIEGNTGPDPQDKVNPSHREGVHMHHRTHPYPGFPQSSWGDFNILSAKQMR
jgi:hypothetical protein